MGQQPPLPEALTPLSSERGTLVTALQDVSELSSSLQAARSEAGERETALLEVTQRAESAEVRAELAEKRAAQNEAIIAMLKQQLLEYQRETAGVLLMEEGAPTGKGAHMWDARAERREKELARVTKERTTLVMASPRGTADGEESPVGSPHSNDGFVLVGSGLSMMQIG